MKRPMTSLRRPAAPRATDPFLLYPDLGPHERDVPALVGRNVDTIDACGLGIISGTAKRARRLLQEGADEAHILRELLRTIEQTDAAVLAASEAWQRQMAEKSAGAAKAKGASCRTP